MTTKSLPTRSPVSTDAPKRAMGAWVLLGQKKTKRSVTSPLMYIYCFVLRVDTSKSGLMDVSLLAPI